MRCRIACDFIDFGCRKANVRAASCSASRHEAGIEGPPVHVGFELASMMSCRCFSVIICEGPLWLRRRQMPRFVSRSEYRISGIPGQHVSHCGRVVLLCNFNVLLSVLGPI